MNPQLPELLRLRWRMIRSERSRIGLLALAALIPGAFAGSVIAGFLASRVAGGLAGQGSAGELMLPAAYLGFAVIAIVAPLAVGGAHQLFPADQLVAFPVRPATESYASLVLAPLNLAWLSQALVLFGVTSYVVGPRPGLGAALIVTLLYVAAWTVLGQAAAWLFVGLRRRVRGRRLLWALAIASGAATVGVMRADAGVAAIRHSPGRPVAALALTGADEHYGVWLAGCAVLAALAIAGLALGVRACAWALRRPGDAAPERAPAWSVLDRPPRGRRRRPRGAFSELLAVDRASVWRSPALRRGVAVLAFLPAAVAAGAGLSWRNLVLVPALVAAGSVLVFGVNAFCLDGGGALWLASLPHRPRLAAGAKVVVVTETCLGTCLVALAAGALRAPAGPTATEAAAVAASAITCVATAVAIGVRLSLRRPWHADLRGPRDTPAPPATMAVYAAWLALACTLTALAFAAAERTGDWRVPLLLAVPLTARALASLATSLRAWDDPLVRARVVTTVASG